jgi:hypothetical protein
MNTLLLSIGNKEVFVNLHKSKIQISLSKRVWIEKTVEPGVHLNHLVLVEKQTKPKGAEVVESYIVRAAAHARNTSGFVLLFMIFNGTKTPSLYTSEFMSTDERVSIAGKRQTALSGDEPATKKLRMSDKELEEYMKNVELEKAPHFSTVKDVWTNVLAYLTRQDAFDTVMEVNTVSMDAVLDSTGYKNEEQNILLLTAMGYDIALRELLMRSKSLNRDIFTFALRRVIEDAQTEGAIQFKCAIELLKDGRADPNYVFTDLTYIYDNLYSVFGGLNLYGTVLSKKTDLEEQRNYATYREYLTSARENFYPTRLKLFEHLTGQTDAWSMYYNALAHALAYKKTPESFVRYLIDNCEWNREAVKFILANKDADHEYGGPTFLISEKLLSHIGNKFNLDPVFLFYVVRKDVLLSRKIFDNLEEQAVTKNTLDCFVQAIKLDKTDLLEKLVNSNWNVIEHRVIEECANHLFIRAVEVTKLDIVKQIDKRCHIIITKEIIAAYARKPLDKRNMEYISIKVIEQEKNDETSIDLLIDWTQCLLYAFKKGLLKKESEFYMLCASFKREITRFEDIANIVQYGNEHGRIREWMEEALRRELNNDMIETCSSIITHIMRHCRREMYELKGIRKYGLNFLEQVDEKDTELHSNTLMALLSNGVLLERIEEEDGWDRLFEKLLEIARNLRPTVKTIDMFLPGVSLEHFRAGLIETFEGHLDEDTEEDDEKSDEDE